MIRKLETIIKMIKVRYLSAYAMEVANHYWQHTSKTHGSMDKENFDFYYNGLFEILNPKKDDLILDYAGRSGEIAFRFKHNGFLMEHCDLSKVIVGNARNIYNLKSFVCKDLHNKQYDKILFNNAFFMFILLFKKKY